MTASRFLQELKKENLSGREFLALMGHTGMSNENYTEIKENPKISYKRLIEILENSPISSAEYVRLLVVARKRAAKKQRQALEKKLSAAISEKSADSQNTEDLKPAVPEIRENFEKSEIPYIPEKSEKPEISEYTEYTAFTEEITLPDYSQTGEQTGEQTDGEQQAQAFGLYEDPNGDDLWEGIDGDEFDPRNLDTPDLLEEFAEYGGSEDFSKDAARENLAKIIICLTLAVFLTAGSYFIRSFGLAETIFTPKSYEDIYELNKTRSYPETPEKTQSPSFFRAENFTEKTNFLNPTAHNDRYIFKVADNNIYVVEIQAGHMSDVAIFKAKPDLTNLGVFESKGKLYAVYSRFDETTALNSVVIYEFNAFEFSNIPLNEYYIEGVLKEIAAHNDGFLAVLHYTRRNTADENDYAAYIPSYGVKAAGAETALEKSLTEFKDIEFVGESESSAMTVVVNAANGAAAVFAVYGDIPDGVFFNEKAALFSFFNAEKNQTQVLRREFTDVNSKCGAWVKIDGFVKNGAMDERAGVIRIVADNGGTGELSIFNQNMKPLAAKLGQIASNEGIAGVAFAEKAVYIVSENEGQVYAADTSNSGKPVFVNELNALVSDDVFYPFGQEHFYSVNTDNDSDSSGRTTVTLTMYHAAGNTAPVVQAVYKLSPSDEIWYDSTRTSVEAVFAPDGGYDLSSKSGVIVLPVTYFNLSRTECFFVLNYAQDTGFTKAGTIVDITGLRYNRELSAIVQGGYIYTLWDNMIQSAMSDSTMLSSHSFID